MRYAIFPLWHLHVADSRCGTAVLLPDPASGTAPLQSAYECNWNRGWNHKWAGRRTLPSSRRKKRRQLRPLTLTPGYVQTAEGSVLVSLGNTRVLTNATIEQGVPGWLRNSGRGWVTAEYAMLPRSTVTRTPRESERGKIGGRTHEIQRLIGQKPAVGS